ncbi:hypothetical protein OSTOST_17345 [Ostertagia ostertagi]
MHPSASMYDAPPPYDEVKAQTSSQGEESTVQGGSQSNRPPPYDGERTLPRDLDFLPKVEVVSSKRCGCSVIRAQPGSEHDGQQTTVLCDDCRRVEEQVDGSWDKCCAQVAAEVMIRLAFDLCLALICLR